jgi:replication factor C large subunit
MSIPWTIKYKPKNKSEYVNNFEALRKLERWLLSQKKIPSSKKAAFLYGPPGVGKTISVEVLAKEHDFDLIEMNASDWRNRESLEKLAEISSNQSTLYGIRNRILLLDELEGLSSRGDRGSIRAIVNLIKKTSHFLIFAANNAWDPKFSSFRTYCLLIRFKPIPTQSVIRHLRRICTEEEINVEDKVLHSIAKLSKGDLRSAVTDLQIITQGQPYVTDDDVKWLTPRDRQKAIFDVLRLIFTSKNYLDVRRAIDMVDTNHEMLFEWIYENLPRQVMDKKDLFKGMEALARADIFMNRIKRFQNWSLLKYYLDLITLGVAMANDKRYQKWIPFKFPERIKIMAKTFRQRKLQMKVGSLLREKCHTSSIQVVREYLPYLRIIFEHDPEMARKLSIDLNLDKEAIDFLSKN